MVLPARVVKPPTTSNGTVNQLADGARQLVLDVFVCPSNSEKKKVRALIDTGAQINVIRRGLFPEESLQQAKKPLMLTLADGQAFGGGDKEIAATLYMGRQRNACIEPWKAKAQFYVGEVKADAILGYPWLAQNGLDVLTREGCLGQRMGKNTYTITDCPEIDEWDAVPFIDTCPIQMLERGASPPGPHRALGKRPSQLHSWAEGQVAWIEGHLPAPPSPPPGWHHTALPPISSSQANQALVSCIQKNKRMIYENEADSMLVACLQGGEIPKETFNVPGDDDDEHEDLDDVEKWEIAKKLVSTKNWQHFWHLCVCR